MSHDCPKRICRVPCNFTEREFADLAALANADNRTLSDMLYVITRRYMYGRVRTGAPAGQPSRSASEAHADFAETDFQGRA